MEKVIQAIPRMEAFITEIGRSIEAPVEGILAKVRDWKSMIVEEVGDLRDLKF